jgi:hypothetical protein
MVFVLILSVMAIVIPAVPILAAGLTLSVTSGPYNTYVTATGTAFANSTAYSVQFGTGTTYVQTVAQGTTSPVGDFTTNFWIPNYPGGSYTVTAVAGTTVATATFNITGTFTADKTSGKVGDTITLAGQGFTASRNITAYFDSAAAGTTTADIAGSFTLAIRVPDTYRGNHTLRIADYQGYSTSTLSFAVDPSLAVSPTSIAIGGHVSVSGKGFTASSPLSFTLDLISLEASANTNASGAFGPISLVIPATSAGSHTLKVTDGSGARVTADIDTSNNMSISPETGPTGTKVTIQGEGYAANAPITITLNGEAISTLSTSITSDGAGNFTASFLSPPIPSGTYAIVVSDGTNSATANFVSTFTFSSSVNQGQVGTSVPLSGNGFKAGATVSIKFDNAQIVTSTADSAGTFSALLVIPPSRSGNHTILVSDGLNSDTITFRVDPAIETTPTTGNVGTEIVIKGFSFDVNAMVSVRYDNAQVMAAGADLNGTFSTSFRAPVSKGGNHVIIISDGITSLTANFTMESTAPSIPKPTMPEKESQVDALAQFEWQPVNDPSGISYSLQIARDAGFNALVINKTDLATTAYQITESEQLKPSDKSKPYFWRVKATDGALNQSEWSTPQTFIVGSTMSRWIWYLIYGGAAIVIFVLGVMLGRWTAR